MKKRTLISTLLTICFLFITHNLWLNIIPIPINMDILGNGNLKIQAQVNKKNNDEFKQIEAKELKINLNKTKRLKFEIPNTLTPQKMQFIFSNFTDDTPITIKNINLRNNKLKLKNDAFIVSGGGKSLITKDAITLYPQKDTSKIVVKYNEKIKIRASIKLEFEIFVSLLILGFLLIYKLTDYLADFKTIKNQSRIDIVFLLIFFVLLFIPMSKINQDKISQQENRTLTKWQTLITNKKKINLNFGKNFDKWFDDRFNGRDFLLNINSNIKKTLNMNFYSNSSFIWNKKNNWMGHKKFLSQNNTKYFTKNELTIASNNVKRIKKICDEHNIKLYILIAPYKEEIYSKKILNGKHDFNMHKKNIQMKNHIKATTNVDIIYIYDELKELSNYEFAFFKTDTHWTDMGAYKGYLALMKEIKNDFPNIHINDLNDYEIYKSNKVRVTPKYFYEGRTAKLLDITNSKILDTEYKYFKHKDNNIIQTKTTNCEKGCWIREYNYQNNFPNLYFYGNSFTLNLLPIIPFSFKYTKNVYIPIHQENSNLEKYEKDIKETKPDILVLCFSGMDSLKLMYKGKK